MTLNSIFSVVGAGVLMGFLSACGGGATTSALSSAATPLSVAQALFAEKSLSASGKQSCASCHTDDNAHADATGTVLPVGGGAHGPARISQQPQLDVPGQ